MTDATIRPHEIFFIGEVQAAIKKSSELAGPSGLVADNQTC